MLRSRDVENTKTTAFSVQYYIFGVGLQFCTLSAVKFAKQLAHIGQHLQHKPEFFSRHQYVSFIIAKRLLRKVFEAQSR